ncbi:MAG: hypothetical protein AAFW68_00830 [Pseudomonadota bacterium]
MTRIVFATCLAQPQLQESDAVLACALEARGSAVRAAPWNGDQDPFRDGDAVIIRSTWDYQESPDRFADWLETLGARAHVYNPPALMRWNMSKRYLLTLAECGAAMPATRLVEPTSESVAAAMDAMGLDEAVVKPEFGATASGLSVVRRGDWPGLGAAAAKLAMPGLIQPLMSEISSVGETSLVFLDGAFSHAVIKRPAAGDIRCQAEFGGRCERVGPPPAVVAQARRILEMLPTEPLYARIDGLILDERLQLMEVELIEPELFFTYCPEAEMGAADRFAAAILNRL